MQKLKGLRGCISKSQQCEENLMGGKKYSALYCILGGDGKDGLNVHLWEKLNGNSEGIAQPQS